MSTIWSEVKTFGKYERLHKYNITDNWYRQESQPLSDLKSKESTIIISDDVVLQGSKQVEITNSICLISGLFMEVFVKESGFYRLLQYRKLLF